ncbi:hypothetical protein AALO_G00261390 [Alosa alosa]|uniref:Uncharacterized protein n=1 Tax=Alosa alosa TaxID=278164 RepID=A0AAV6FTL1_9TELE|nr:hypothetical protein AALO_G00261390 [Alosa alosa]
MPCPTSWAPRRGSAPLTCPSSWLNSPSQMVQVEPSRPPQRKLQHHWRVPRSRMAPKTPLPHHQGALSDFSSLGGRRGWKRENGGGKRRGATDVPLAELLGVNCGVTSGVTT